MDRNCLNCKYEQIAPTAKPCCDCFGYECWEAKDNSIISDILKKNGNTNYQPLSGEESKSQGGNKHGKMADRTTPEPDTKRLDGPERKPRESNNAGA